MFGNFAICSFTASTSALDVFKASSSTKYDKGQTALTTLHLCEVLRSLELESLKFVVYSYSISCVQAYKSFTLSRTCSLSPFVSCQAIGSSACSCFSRASTYSDSNLYIYHLQTPSCKKLKKYTRKSKGTF